MADIDEFNFRVLVRSFAEGRAVPFLGAGVNLCDRPADLQWQAGSGYLPSGWELTTHLIKEFRYPEDELQDMKRVSEYAVIQEGRTELYRSLRALFDSDYSPTTVHGVLASLPGLLREKGYPDSHQLIVTTNYDDVMERALDEAGEPYDSVVYILGTDERKEPRLVHISEGKSQVISGQYTGLPFTRKGSLVSDTLTRSLILKIHGAVDRADPENDSYVITEDNYVEYLARRDIAKLLPRHLVNKLAQSRLLFLGYSITDWNLRVFLNRLLMQRTENDDTRSYAIQRTPSRLDVKYWEKKLVKVSNIPLADFARALDQEVRALRPAGS